MDPQFNQILQLLFGGGAPAPASDPLVPPVNAPVFGSSSGITYAIDQTKRAFGMPTAPRKEEFIAGERQQAVAQQAAASQAEREATFEIMRLASETQAKMPGVPPHVLFKSIVSSPQFGSHAMRVPADKMQKLVQDMVGSISAPPAPKPIAVGEGAALFDPVTRQQIFKNEKPVEESGRTKAEQTELAKRSVASLDKVVEAGQQARMDQIAIEQLDALGERIGTGGAATIRSYLARVGVDLGDASDIQAFESLVDRLTPSQRQGLPGAASDRDVAMFKSALPSLIRQPGGNKTIIATLRAMAQDRIKRADIADQVFTGDITVPQALRSMRDLPSPLKRFQESDEGKRLLKSEEPKLAPTATERPKVRLRFNSKTNALEPVQ